MTPINVYVERENLALRLHEIPLSQPPALTIEGMGALPEAGVQSDFQGESVFVLRREVDIDSNREHPGRALLVVATAIA